MPENILKSMSRNELDMTRSLIREDDPFAKHKRAVLDAEIGKRRMDNTSEPKKTPRKRGKPPTMDLEPGKDGP